MAVGISSERLAFFKHNTTKFFKVILTSDAKDVKNTMRNAVLLTSFTWPPD